MNQQLKLGAIEHPLPETPANRMRELIELARRGIPVIGSPFRDEQGRWFIPTGPKEEQSA